MLPGDVILGTPTGVIAIPPHLAEEVAESAEDTVVRDRFGKLRLAEGKYTSGEIDVSVWRPDIEADFRRLAARRSHHDPIVPSVRRLMGRVCPLIGELLGGPFVYVDPKASARPLATDNRP